MVFIARVPVIQNSFLRHNSVNNTTAEAGQVVYLSGDQQVSVVSGTGNTPYGFLLQKIKAEISGMPAGYRTAADHGSSDAFTGDPVGVAHLGIYDTTQYVLDAGETTFTAGELLYADAASNKGKVVNGASGDVAQEGGSDKVVAIVQNSLSASAITAGAALRIKLLI